MAAKVSWPKSQSFNSKFDIYNRLKLYYTSYPNISMFHALSQNYQNLFEK